MRFMKMLGLAVLADLALALCASRSAEATFGLDGSLVADDAATSRIGKSRHSNLAGGCTRRQTTSRTGLKAALPPTNHRPPNPQHDRKALIQPALA